MKTIYHRMLQIGLLVLVLISLSNMSFETNASPNQGPKNNNILAIYDDNTYQNVINLYNDRLAFNTTLLPIHYVNLNNDTQTNNFITNQQNLKSYDEFWLVTNQLHDHKNIIPIVSEILSLNLPTLIWTPDLYVFNSTIQAKLGLNSCQNDSISKDQINYTLSYNDFKNLTALLNTSPPTLAPIQGSLDLANCSLSSNAYKIINVIVSSQPLPLLYGSNFKSNVLIAPFYLDTQNEVSTTTEYNSNGNNINNGSPNAMSTANLNAQFNQNQIPLINTISATNSVNQNDFTGFLSTFTYYLASGWSSSVSFPNTTPISGTITSANNNPLGFLSTGITLPKIDPQLATGIAVGTAGIGLISLIVLLIRRYWLALLGALVAVIAVFKVPSRKISVMDVYHNETRQNIIDILNYKKGQGETVRNISRELEIPLPTLLWHLQILEEFELIAKIKVKREVVIISMDYIEEFDLELKEFEMTFKSDKAKTFYDYLLNLQQNEIFTMKSVVTHTGWSSRTVIRYISKLLDLDIIEQNGTGKGYKITTKYYYKLKELN